MGKRGPQPSPDAKTPAERQRACRQRKRDQTEKQRPAALHLGGFERYVLKELALAGESETETASRLLTELLHALAATRGIEEKTRRLLSACQRKLRDG